ncbi:uncharacterized protein LOC107489111 [Arachis duranensis]|uniref:Uncharacterized protein LOC107489111 n=1 Tax=Arachis duranensis TaxID=130453 RepID=A0A6P4DDT6_ARADU|nr:uncharacterized protein LOC107489111 [Arachis duranensis]
MKPRDKTTLDGASNGSLKKYKTTEEAWQLISDLAKFAQNYRHWNNHQRFPLCWRDNSNQGWRDNYNRGGIDNNRNDRWNNNNNRQQNQNQPYKAPHQRQSQVSQNNQQQAPQITYPPSSSNDEMLRTVMQGHQDIQNTINSSINGLTSTIQAFISRMDSLIPSNNQPSSSSAIPSQPLPNPKDGINAITLRSGTILLERSHEELSFKENIQVEDIVGAEDAEEEEEVQDIVEEEVPQNDSGRPSSILLGRPFLMTSKFKLDAFSGTYSFEIDGRAVCFNLTEAMKHPPEDHSIFQCDIIDETIAAVHQEDVEERHKEQGPSVGKPSEHNKYILPSSMAPEDLVPSSE